MQDLQMPAAGLQLFTFKNLQLDSIKTSCRPPSRSDLGVKTGLLRLRNRAGGRGRRSNRSHCQSPREDNLVAYGLYLAEKSHSLRTLFEKLTDFIFSP